jgi:ADP-heptose:LPS heptosyltransferase
MGDAVLILPVLKALKDLFPAARIDVLTGRAGHPVLEGSGLCERCHVVDHPLLSRANASRLSRLRTYLHDRRTFVRAAREIGYDVAIDLYFYFPGAATLLWSAGIPVRCGFTSGGFGKLLSHPVVWSFGNRHISQFGLELMKTLWPEQTAALGPLPLFYPGHPVAVGLPTCPYIVLHSGAGGPWKEWPEAQWRTLTEALLRERREQLVFCGTGGTEKKRSRRLASLAAPGRASLYIDQGWDDYVALIAGAAFVICLDSVSTHLAAAFSIPTVAIYSGCNEIELWGPGNPNARVLTAPTLCAPCHRPDGCEAMACVREVAADDVLAALRDLESTRISGA